MILEQINLGHYEYWVAKPDNWDSNKDYAILLFFHGAGAQGGSIDQVLTDGGITPIQQCNIDAFKNPETGEDWNIVVIAPHLTDPNWNIWKPVDDVYKNADLLKIDKTKISVTGLSLGSIAITVNLETDPVYYLYHPIVGAYPISGSKWGYSPEAAQRVVDKNVILRGWYGTEDASWVLGMEGNAAGVNAIQPGYYDLRPIEGAGHTAAAWGKVYGEHDPTSPFNIYKEIESGIINIPPVGPPIEDLNLYDVNGNLMYLKV